MITYSARSSHEWFRAPFNSLYDEVHGTSVPPNIFPFFFFQEKRVKLNIINSMLGILATSLFIRLI